jgi:hypothetical protein
VPLSLADGGQGLVTEYWTGADRVFFCYGRACGWPGDIVLAGRHRAGWATSCWPGDIVLAGRVVGHEAAD